MNAHIEISTDEMASIIDALKKDAVSQASNADRLARSIADRGWAHSYDLEDFINAQDSRLQWIWLGRPAEYSAGLELNFRWAYLRPQNDDEPTGYEMLSSAETAMLMIWLERLGFCMDATAFCRMVKAKLAQTSHVSEAELAVLRYEQERHKQPPISLRTPVGEIKTLHPETFETSTGYEVTATYHENGLPFALEVMAPDYREPEPEVLTKCDECGMTYVKGLPQDNRDHNTEHRKVLDTLNPRPSLALKKAFGRNAKAVWVGADAPKWLRLAIDRRARAFKREFGYDFIQWQVEGSNDPEAIGFIFHDSSFRIVGACCFRPEDDASDQMRLDWIWIFPDARRSGVLSREWKNFQSRFGDFRIETPISQAMQGFLKSQNLT